MGSRTWIKIYCDKWLNGTIREESPEFRGIWVDLLALAGSGTYADMGEIKATDHVGFLDEQLANLLQISRQKWVAYKKKLIESDRVYLKNGNIIGITNWSKYQSEYRRQKPYREPPSHTQDTIEKVTESCNHLLQDGLQDQVVTKSTPRDRDREERKEIEKREKVSQSPSIESVINAYQDNILAGATISEEMNYELTGACRRYSPEWVIDGIKEAIAQNQPTWRYIMGILKNWSQERR